MHFVSPWTILYGVIGSVCFWASIRRGDRQSFFYGGMLLISWLFAAVASGSLTATQAPFLIIVADGGIAFAIALDLRQRPAARGWAILNLFLLEAVAHFAAATIGFWGATFHYLLINVIWAAQVLIAGGVNVVGVIVDWGDRSGAHVRIRRSRG